MAVRPPGEWTVCIDHQFLSYSTFVLFRSGKDPISLIFLLGNTLQKRLSLCHFKLDWKTGRIFPQVNIHQLTESFLWFESHFQDDDHDVHPPLAAAYAAAYAGFPLPHRAHVVCATVSDPYYIHTCSLITSCLCTVYHYWPPAVWALFCL